MARLGSGLIVAAALTLGSIGSPAAQEPARPDIHAYYVLASEYLEGDPDRAVAELVKLTPNKPEEILAMRRRRWSVDVMRAAALLETEAALASGSIGILKTRLSLAQSWLDETHRALPRQVRDEFSPAWYSTTSRKLLMESIGGLADEMLRKASEMFRDEPAVFLAYGLTRETSAFIVDGASVLDSVFSSRPTFLMASQAARNRALSDARAALQTAVRLDPASTEAQLRLAHVYLALKDERRAVPLLEQVSSGNGSRPYRYIASILLGDVHAGRGQLEPAVVLYLAARNLVPSGQSSYIAHAHALRSAGQTDAAAEVVSTMLARDSREEDPWTQYPRGFELVAADLKRLRLMMRIP